jgi:hypothetical protein
VRSPFEVLADLITTRPVLVILAVFLLIVVSFIGTTFVTMETGSDTYIDKNSPRGMLLDKYTSTFQSDSIMLLVESDNVMDSGVLAYMDRIEREIAEQRYVTGVSGVVAVLKGQHGGSLPQTIGEVAEIRERLPPAALSRYVPSNTMAISVVTLEPGLTQRMKNTVITNFEAIVRLSDPPPGVQVVITGDAAFQQQMGQEMGKSMGILIMVAMVLMVVAIGLFFSHVKFRFLPVVLVACGLVLTFGIVGFTRLPITMVTIAAFPVLIGIGIDYAINFHARFDEEARRSSITVAARTTIEKAGPSILYAFLSTSMGFLALLISPVPMIRSFGIVCVIGVASCYIVSLLLVPAVGVAFHYRPKVSPGGGDAQSGGGHAMDRYNIAVGSLAGVIARNAIPILLVCAVIGFVGYEMDNEIIINTNEDTFVPADMPAKVNLDKVTRTMGATSSVPIYVRGDNVLDIGTLRWMQEFQDFEESQNSKVTGSTSIATLIAQYNEGSLPSTNGELKESLERVPDDLKRRYLNGNTEAVILFSTVQMENEVALAVIENLRRELAWHQPPTGVSASVTGMGELFSNLIQEIAAGKNQMTSLAFVLIFVFLFIVYRKFLKAATPIVPIMMIVGWNGLVMFVLGIDYTPMTATLGSMTIGVASEYTILIMERYHEERSRGLPSFEAICHATKQIGTAITVSGMTTVFGFAALLFSSFNMISNFGLVTVITVAFSLAGAIIVMPAILMLTGQLEQRGSPVPESGSPPV